LYRLLCEQHPDAEVWRSHVNDCLELAIRYELKDADLDSRLIGGDRDTFEAAINELKCARCLEDIFGKSSLRWHPQGSEGRIGEFEIVSDGMAKPIFVEVKTISPRAEERLEWRVRGKLRRYAKQVALPFMLSVHIEEVGKAEDFSGKRFKSFLEAELAKIGSVKARLPDYMDDKTGLHLEIDVSPISQKKPLRSCYIGIIGGNLKCLGTDEYVKHSLKKAYRQHPTVNQPYLVMLCHSTQFPIDEDDMMNALFGTLAYSYPRFAGTPPVGAREGPIRLPDGFFRPRRNRCLSAAAVYGEKFTEKAVQGDFEIYHNPWALNPLESIVFEGKCVRQFVRIDDKEMGWRN